MTKEDSVAWPWGHWLKNEIVGIEDGCLILPNDTKLDYQLECEESTQTYWRKDKRGTHKIWGGSLTGEVVQALAAVYLREVILEINDDGGMRPAWLRHDEAVYVVEEDDVAPAMAFMEQTFCRPPFMDA